MAKIFIMDKNRSTSVLLKKALEREEHRVVLSATWQGLLANIEDPSVDLVLIHEEDSGWAAFNKLKNTHQDIPAMLYVIRDYKLSGVFWIVKAVQEALALLNKLDDPPLLWSGDTGCKDSGISFFVPK